MREVEVSIHWQLLSDALRALRPGLSAAFATATVVLTLGACSSLGSGGGLWHRGAAPTADAGSDFITSLVPAERPAAAAGGAAVATPSEGSSDGRIGSHDNTPDTVNVVPIRRLHCLEVKATDLSTSFQRLATHYGLRLEWLPEDDRRILQGYKLRFDCFEEALRQLLLLNPLLVADIYYPNRVLVVRDADRHTEVDTTPLRCETSPIRLARPLQPCAGERPQQAAVPRRSETATATSDRQIPTPSAQTSRGQARAEARAAREERRRQRHAEREERLRQRRAEREKPVERAARTPRTPAPAARVPAPAARVEVPSSGRVERSERVERELQAARAVSRRNPWTVRVAVYDRPTGAQRMLERLRADNFMAYVASVQSGARTFSGLYVGTNLSKRRAERLAKALDRRYGLATLVVIRKAGPEAEASPTGEAR